MPKQPFKIRDVVVGERGSLIVNKIFLKDNEWYFLGDTFYWHGNARHITQYCHMYKASDFVSAEEPQGESFDWSKLKIKMSNTSIIAGSIIGFVVLMGFWFMGNYNSLVTAKAQVDNAWAQVETQYQRRFDLVDNLVSSVKGGQKQEVEVFGKIAEARKMVATAQSVDDKVAAVNQMETNLAMIPRLQEAYPELKSNELVQNLMKELTGTENNIAVKRDAFNQTATNYNVNITQFPKALFAQSFGFEKVSLFKSVSDADKAVKVQF